MRICENGIYRDMTAEEIAELEKDNAELREAMEALLSGVTA